MKYALALGGSTCLLLAATLPMSRPLPADDSWMNCFAVVAGKDCTVDGSVLFAHNEDSGHANPVHFHVVAAAEHQDIEAQRLVAGGSEPFAPKTHSYIWCQMPGLRYSDTYFNEHGVAIATNGCHSREENPELTDGGITYMLRRIVAARSRTALEGVEVVAELLAKYGYGDTGRTMTIADAKEAWIVNIARGKHWVAARVPDDQCAAIANHFTIHTVDLADKKRFRASDGLIEHAIARGWFDPKLDGEFDFATVYGADGARKHRSNIRRVWRAYSLLAKKPTEEQWNQPTFVTPKHKLSKKDLMAVLRDHYEGTEYDTSENYSKCSPYAMRQPTICANGTSYSTVFELRSGLPATVGCVMWIAMSRPDASPYVPWYAGLLRAPDDYAITKPDAALRRHFDADYKATGSPPAFREVQAMQVALNPYYGGFFADIAARRDAFEARLFAGQARLEADAKRIHTKDPQAARKMLTNFARNQQARARQIIAQWQAGIGKPRPGKTAPKREARRGR